MASLVAYDSGSEEEEEDDSMTDDSPVTSSSAPSSTSTSAQYVPVPKAQPSASSVPLKKSSVIFSKFMDDEADEDLETLGDTIEEGVAPIWSKYLPQPKKVSNEGVVAEDDVEIGPIPPKKVYGDEELIPSKPSSIPSLTATKVKGKVRISIPFLNSLDEVETEDPDKRRIMQPSQKGSGLFARLPQPKNSMGVTPSVFTKSVKESTNHESVQSTSNNNSDHAPRPVASMNKLVPDSVKNKLKRSATDRLEEVRAKYSKKEFKLPGKSSTAKDSDSDDDGQDFFSLDSTESADPEALEKLKLPMPDFESQRRSIVQNTEAMDIEEEEEEPVPTTSRSNDLMKFIQPKKGRKEEINIIDISADDLRPDNTEWLKNITDESAAPARRSKGLGGMVKRKHQITYLAFEAKAREQELKNQWAQNRANKMASQNKYGF